jgi:hypothetical protein
MNVDEIVFLLKLLRKLNMWAGFGKNTEEWESYANRHRCTPREEKI